MKKFILTSLFLSMGLVASAQDLEGFVNENDLISLRTLNGPLDVVGVDFRSAGGFLVPTDDADPWDIVIARTSNRVTLGNLASSVMLDGTVATSVGYTGSDPDSDLVANWGSDVNEVRFPVFDIPEPSGFLLGTFAIFGLLGFRRRCS